MATPWGSLNVTPLVPMPSEKDLVEFPEIVTMRHSPGAGVGEADGTERVGVALGLALGLTLGVALNDGGHTNARRELPLAYAKAM